MFLRPGWYLLALSLLTACVLTPATPGRDSNTATPARTLPPPQVSTQAPPARQVTLAVGEPGADVDGDGRADVRLALAQTAAGPRLELHPGVQCAENGCESLAQLAWPPCQAWSAAGVAALAGQTLCLRASAGGRYRLTLQPGTPLQTVELAFYAE